VVEGRGEEGWGVSRCGGGREEGKREGKKKKKEI